jgi:hypothetical protein
MSKKYNFNMKKPRVEGFYLQLISKLDKLFISFKENEKEILFLLDSTKSLPQSHFFAYFNFLKRQEKDFGKYLQYQKIKEKANKHLVTILTSYYEYIRFYDQFTNHVQTIKDIDKYKINTIRKILIKTNMYNKEMLDTLVIDYNAEFNDYIQNLSDLEDLLIELKANLSIIEHLVYTSYVFETKIDYTKIKKMGLEDLETGDLIFFDENPKTTHSFVTKQISKVTKTSILHLALFYDSEKKKYFIFQARGANRKKTYVAPIEIQKGYKYIILRIKKGLSYSEKELVKKTVVENINIKFSLTKLYFASLNVLLLRLYKSWMPFLDIGSNPWKTSKVFCSEIIATIYKNLGHNIANKPDAAEVSPIDLFNSPELEIIGYIEK